MDKYTVQLTKKGEKQLDKLSDHIALPILEAIQQLVDQPRPLTRLQKTERTFRLQNQTGKLSDYL